MFNVVEGLIPAIPASEYFEAVQNKRKIRNTRYLQTLCHPMNLKTINASSTKGAALLFIQKLFLLSSSRVEPDG